MSHFLKSAKICIFIPSFGPKNRFYGPEVALLSFQMIFLSSIISAVLFNYLWEPLWVVWYMFGCESHWNHWKMPFLPPDLGLEYGFPGPEVPKKTFWFFVTSIPYRWWRLTVIKSKSERVRSFFFQKLRFLYIFPYISVHKAREKKTLVYRPIL